MKISDMENATKAIRILRSVQYELKQIQSLEIELMDYLESIGVVVYGQDKSD
jgi:hypothetical protein